jgi:hypothetical protein
MRPDKAVVIVYLSDSLFEVQSLLIQKAICGRLVLRSDLISTLLSHQENSLFCSDEDFPGTEKIPENLDEELIKSEKKVFYLFLRSPEKIQTILEICLNKKYICSMILQKLYPIPEPRSELTPKQSYMFENYEEISTSFTGSVFYCDLEAGYTRKDWLAGIQDVDQIGGNNLILAEKHHLELLTRMGLKPKYGA